MASKRKRTDDMEDNLKRVAAEERDEARAAAGLLKAAKDKIAAGLKKVFGRGSRGRAYVGWSYFSAC